MTTPIGPGDSTMLAKRLKETREYLNYSQQHVAERTGIPRTAISEIERGARRVDSLELKKLARLYRYPVSYFLDEDLDAVPAEHALAGLPRRLTTLTPGDFDQVMRFADFLRQSYVADAEAGEALDHEVPERRGAAS